MSMEDAYEKLRKDGHNTVDNLIQLLKDANLITAKSSKESEANIKKLLQEADDQANVDLERFKEAVTILAKEQDRAMAEVCTALHNELPKLAHAIQEAAKAFDEALKKK